MLVVADELAHAFAMHHFERHAIGQAEASVACLPAAGRAQVVQFRVHPDDFAAGQHGPVPGFDRLPAEPRLEERPGLLPS